MKRGNMLFYKEYRSYFMEELLIYKILMRNKIVVFRRSKFTILWIKLRKYM